MRRHERVDFVNIRDECSEFDGLGSLRQIDNVLPTAILDSDPAPARV